MQFINGRDFAATCVRYQLIAQNDILDKPEYMVKFYKETASTWTVVYTPTVGWPIYLCIMLTNDEIDPDDPVFHATFKTEFPENSYVKKICVFRIDQQFKILDKKWIEKIRANN